MTVRSLPKDSDRLIFAYEIHNKVGEKATARHNGPTDNQVKDRGSA